MPGVGAATDAIHEHAWRPAGPTTRVPKTAVIATGPCLEGPIVAGADDAWLELMPAPNSSAYTRFDTSKDTFVVRLVRDWAPGSADISSSKAEIMPPSSLA